MRWATTNLRIKDRKTFKRLKMKVDGAFYIKRNEILCASNVKSKYAQTVPCLAATKSMTFAV